MADSEKKWKQTMRYKQLKAAVSKALHATLKEVEDAKKRLNKHHKELQRKIRALDCD